MSTDNKNMPDTEVMLGELDRIVSAELKKKDSERDDKLIDECIEEMAKLKNVHAGYDKEEIDAMFEEIQAKASGTSKKSPVRRMGVRRSIAAACAACLVLVCGVATVAYNPFEFVKEWIYSITDTPDGTDTKIKGITYTNHGKYTKYDDIQELIKNENLNIYYPTVLPNTVSIIRVEPLIIDNKEYINFHFNDSSVKFMVQRNASLYLNIPEYETIKTNDTTFYLSYQNDKYTARCNIDLDLYLIECSDYQDILLIINGFTKGD